MFALEAVRAKHGDCLLLHWGNDKIALVDGGPDTVYENFLKDRLKAIATERGEDRIVLDLTMVSHIDDDHINGILALADDFENGDAPADIRLLWFNSLEGLLNDSIAEGSTAEVTAAVNSIVPHVNDKWTQKVLASVPQGQLLHAFAKRRGIFRMMNSPYQPLIMTAADQDPAPIAGLSVTVIGPFADEVEELRKKWKELRDASITAAFNDKSPYNLSSIVALCEFGGKRVLLTGDARGDKIIDGLTKKKLMRDGVIHLDILKLPHHGSQNNVAKEFFERVTADIYVVSGDQKRFPNPHKKAMQWLAEARADSDYEVYCTYDLADLKRIFGRKLRVPKDDETSITATI
jgi:hypothetical protein